MAGRWEGRLGGMEGPDGGGVGSEGAHAPPAKCVWAQDSRPKAWWLKRCLIWNCAMVESLLRPTLLVLGRAFAENLLKPKFVGSRMF